MAKIKIKNLKVKSLIGVYDFERETKCELIFNIELDYDASRAGQSDDIAHAIDYGLLANKISDFVSSARFFLLEKLAQSVLDLILEDERVQYAQVEVDKPGILEHAESVSVTVCSAK